LKDAAKNVGFFLRGHLVTVGQIPVASCGCGGYAMPEHIIAVHNRYFSQVKKRFTLDKGARLFKHPGIFRGQKKTICIYASIRYYDLHRVVQQELDNVKGEDLCVY
jgi:hypothetical protein